MVLHGIALHLMILHSLACHCIVSYGVAWYCIVGFGARAVSRKTPTYFIGIIQKVHHESDKKHLSPQSGKMEVIYRILGAMALQDS